MFVRPAMHITRISLKDGRQHRPSQVTGEKMLKVLLQISFLNSNYSSIKTQKSIHKKYNRLPHITSFMFQNHNY